MVLTSRAVEALGAGARADDVVGGIERALGAGVLADDPLAANLHLVHAIAILSACGGAEAAIGHADHALADPRIAGADLLTAAVRAGRAWALLHRDRLHEARTDAEAALGYLAEHAPILVGTALDPAVRALLAQGEIVEAQQLLIAVGVREDGLDLGGLARLAHARVVLAGGDLRHGVEAVLDARARLAAPAANESVTPGAADAVDALIAVGDIDRAAAIAEALLARQRAFGEQRGLGLALRAAAAVAASPKKRIDLLEEADEALALAAAPVERALVLVRRAEALESSGYRQEARELVRMAAHLAITQGAAPVHAEASRRLVSLGGRPRSARPAGADELSPAERRVAELAADGRSNRDVAAELVVSVKTVEMHLSKTYRKLAISSRAELALALRG